MKSKTVLKCPEPCEIRIITRFREGIIIHNHHFDPVKDRRVLHETFIPYHLLIPSSQDEILPSIDDYKTNCVDKPIVNVL